MCVSIRSSGGLPGAYRPLRGSGRDNAPRRSDRSRGGGAMRNPGDDLLSQGVPPQVPSALAVFTSVFGMGTGVSPPQLSPETYEDVKALVESSRASTSK